MNRLTEHPFSFSVRCSARARFLGMVALAICVLCSRAWGTVRIVATISDYAAIAREVGGDEVKVRVLCPADQDPHFVVPRPSLVIAVQRADLLVHNGLDLELTWLPQILKKAKHRAVNFGEPGNVNASRGVSRLEVPSVADRSQGDIHLKGNPHYSLDPLNGKIIARNIRDGLKRVDAANAARYDARTKDFEKRVSIACYGAALVRAVGARKLDREWKKGGLYSFLESHAHTTAGGRKEPLIGLLGGWCARMRGARGRKIVTFHREWSYFVKRFRLDVVGFVEKTPGTKPSRRHLENLIRRMQKERVELLIAAPFYKSGAIDLVAAKANARIVREDPAVRKNESYIAFIDRMITAASSKGVARHD